MFHKTTHSTKGILLVLATAIISGVAIFINAMFMIGTAPSVYTFQKNILAATAIMLIILIGARYAKDKNFNQLKSLTRKDWRNLGIIGLIGGSIPFLLFFNGLAMIQGTTGAAIHKSMFIFVAIFAFFFLKEKPTKWIVPIALIIFTGNYLIVNPDLTTASLGHILILIATIFWAAENTFSKHVVKKISGTTIAFGRMFFGSIFILLYLAATGQVGSVTLIGAEQWLQLGIAVLFLVGYLLTWYNGIKHIPISLATSILLIGAPVTTLLNYLFLNQGVTVYQIAGSSLVLFGIAAWIYVHKRSEKKSGSILQKTLQSIRN